jgi:glycosyltransferase involved in cell wall biosynthesis
MRVLVLHSRYLSGELSGENAVVDAETELLRSAGHDVAVYSPSYDIQAGRVRGAATAVWSREHAGAVRDLVAAVRPEVVHVHSLYPALSPAVLRSVPRSVPVVMTLHNFRYSCLPATFFRAGGVCEACLGRVPYRGIVHRCYRRSRGASAALAASFTLHRALGSFARVDLFLAVSSFVREKHIEAGLAPERIRVKPNVAPPVPRREGAGSYVLAAGRLTVEKGFDTIVEAAKQVGSELVVVGEGSERGALERSAGPRTRFLGAVPQEKIVELLAGARALAIPSRWYEGSPRVALEALAAGVGVVASRIGGLEELLDRTEAGELVPPDDVEAWGSAVGRLADDDVVLRRGEAAHALWRTRHSPEVTLKELEHAYADAAAAA